MPCGGGAGPLEPPLRLCRAQSTPEKPAGTELPLALTPLTSPSMLPAVAVAEMWLAWLFEEPHRRDSAGLQGMETFSRDKPVGLQSDELGPRKEGPTRGLTSPISVE